MKSKSIAIPLGDELVEASFQERLNRFLLSCQLKENGQNVKVHMADPGRLEELLRPGRPIWLKPAERNGRKTDWSAVLVRSPADDSYVSIDSTLPNRLIRNALMENALEEYKGWHLSRPEFSWGKSRFDFLLHNENEERMILEIKSVTLVEEGVGLFPDAVTARGTRHVEELAHIAGQKGWRAGVLFVVQRRDATSIRAARSIDAKFARALSSAQKEGVQVNGRRCIISLQEVRLGEMVPVNVG